MRIILLAALRSISHLRHRTATAVTISRIVYLGRYHALRHLERPEYRSDSFKALTIRTGVLGEFSVMRLVASIPLSLGIATSTMVHRFEVFGRFTTSSPTRLVPTSNSFSSANNSTHLLDAGCCQQYYFIFSSQPPKGYLRLKCLVWLSILPQASI
jgi:hypothetical protein